jgi:gliding motility-associated-like protein
METKLTLKQLITLAVFLIPAFVGRAQNYSNIEFIENKGQWDSRVKFKGDINAGAVFIRSSGFTVLKHNEEDLSHLRSLDHHNTGALAKGSEDRVVVRSHAVAIDFVDANKNLELVPDKVIPTYNNYFLGNDPSKWASECHIFQAVTLKNVYPNVDVRYYTDNGTLKYDIIARPGADISKIALRYDGVDKLQIKNKALTFNTSLGELKETNPSTYEFDGNQRKEVTCRYVVEGNVVRFDVRGYDPASTLVIDPVPVYCSFSGSTADNWGFTATYGPDGAMYGGGIVRETNGFPVSTGAYQTTFQGGTAGDHPGPIDMGIIKLSYPNLSQRVYATYIGGSGNDQPHSLVVDPAGELIIAGRSNSTDYPIKGTQSTGGGGYDIVVTKLNAAGTGLIGSQKIGGSGNDGVNISIANSVANSLDHNYGDGSRSEVIIDGSGNVYVASSTQSTNFPVTNAAFQRNSGGKQDGVLLKFKPDLSSITFASYLGGSENDAAYVLAIGPNNNIYVAGGTESSNFPGDHTGTVGPSAPGAIDGYVAEITNDGSSIIRSTFIGTSAYDQVYGIQFDRNGFPYIMGQTMGSWTPKNATYVDAGAKQFIGKLQPDLSSYIYTTTFGSGSNIPNISPTAFLVDRCENVYVSGWGGAVSSGYQSAGTTGMRVTPATAVKTTTDGKDFYFFVMKKDAVGPEPLFASFFGQEGGQFPDHVDGGTSRFDANGVIYQAICADCEQGNGTPFPTSPGSWAGIKPASALCNLAMVRIAFNLAGVGAKIQSTIDGVPLDTAGCLPLTVVFTDQVRNATQYIWNFGDGTGNFGPMDADTGYTRSHTYNAVGTYKVMLVAIDPASCNLRDTAYITIRVGDIRANLAMSYQKVGSCNNLDFQFNNLSTPSNPAFPFKPNSFTWDFGDGSAPEVHGTESVLHTFPSPGPYHVKLSLHDTTYCNDPAELDTLINVAANVKADFQTSPTGCAPYNAVFTYTGSGGHTFQWDFGDPASGPDNTSSLANPAHMYLVPGNYTVTLVVTDVNTCNITDTKTISIVVYDKPFASFSYTPVTPVENTPNIFTNLSSANAVKFKWLFGDGDSLVTTSRDPVEHQYNSSGTFNACLIAYNQVGCSDDTCQRVSTIVFPVVDVPNAFTPNSRDVNSIVFVRGFGIVKMRFIIWNRWGQKVFETGNMKEGWDGKVKGVVQPMDVYAYTLDVEFFDGKKASKKGDITLIR